MRSVAYGRRHRRGGHPPHTQCQQRVGGSRHACNKLIGCVVSRCDSQPIENQPNLPIFSRQ